MDSQRRIITRKPSGARLVVAATLFAAVTLPAPRAAAQVVPPCGTRILTAGAVIRLTEDLDCVRGVFDVEAPGVVIDLNGFRIHEQQACERDADESCGIFFGVDSQGSTITNGTLEDIELASRNTDVTFSRLNVIRGTVVLAGRRNQLVDSFLRDSTVRIAHSGVTVRRNWVIGGTGLTLFDLDRQVREFSITNNIVIGSTENGLNFDTNFYDLGDVQGQIAHNLFMRSARAGLYFRGELQNLVTIDIHDNTLLNNGADGIDINGFKFPPIDVPGGPVTLTRNRALNNGGHGINAGWIPGIPTGIVDGGGNVATGNALSPQCIGVAC